LRDQDNTGLRGKTVSLYRDGSSAGLDNLTGDNGYYTILATTPSTPGTYSYTVRFGGDEFYLASESSVVEVTVGARTYKIFGYVTCENVAVENAQVTVDGRSTTTDENGYYEFTGLLGNTSYNIEVSAEGYQTYTGTVFVGNADEKFDVTMTIAETSTIPTAEANTWQIPVAIVVIIIVVSTEVIIVLRTRKGALM
jgi:flagellar capping protein FliD